MPRLGVLAHEGKELGDGLGELRRALASAGFDDVPWRQVARAKKAPKQVRRLLADGVERLLVWGGDGTVRRCIDTIVRDDADIEVAILPAGTANLLATGLGVPLDLDGALDCALRGRSRRIDVGQMNGEAFVVMAGTGFDALMIRDADAGKDRWGRLAYLRAGMRHLGNEGVGARIDVDGGRWFDGRAACVLVGNLGRVLGGVEVFPDAEPDDGRLDIGVLTASSRRDWIAVAARAITGRIDASPLVGITRGASMAVRLDRQMPWELDGGDRPDTTKLDVTVLPQRLAVRVPATP